MNIFMFGGNLLLLYDSHVVYVSFQFELVVFNFMQLPSFSCSRDNMNENNYVPHYYPLEYVWSMV